MTSLTLEQYISNIKTHPEKTEFKTLIDKINQEYEYTPTTFFNGVGDDVLCNEAGTNEGSCRIFAFAQLNHLNKEQTLHCFGHYYREDVLGNPEGDDHGNIRRFIAHGWDGIRFDQAALKAIAH